MPPEPASSFSMQLARGIAGAPVKGHHHGHHEPTENCRLPGLT